MKTPIMVVALAVVALTLAPASNPCQAGSVTYSFTEGSTGPRPGRDRCYDYDLITPRHSHISLASKPHQT